MVKLAELPASLAKQMLAMPVPPFAFEPFVAGPPVNQRRVAIVTTAGLHQRDQARFGFGDPSYRVIPGDFEGAELIMSQGSTNFDRTGFVQDVNTVFPVDRLRELQAQGAVGSIAKFHYSVSAAFSDPFDFEPTARELAELLKNDRVDAAVLIPV